MYLASEPGGNPRTYHPVVRRVDPDQRKGLCWVEELGREVAFQPYDFGISDPAQGQALPEAYIAFNLRGLLLEPARRPGDRQGPTIVTGIPTQASPAPAGTGETMNGIACGAPCRPGQRVLRLVTGLSGCCRSDLEGCASNRSLDRVIAAGHGYESRASW
ncbi:hypothetical protein ACFW95_45900 [Streptomyces sp. NPDC059474]|uniref:hypothetical protein n=1 Tax=unclassified Streptomyces TaxID=2593676 RepID=UPI0033CC3B76